MRLVTLDPGEHIGYALFEDGKYLASGMEMFRDIDRLMKTLVSCKPDVVVAERVVPWGLGALSLNITGVMHTIDYVFRDHKLHWVKASQWKPLVRDKKELLEPYRRRSERKFTTHEGDAICIAQFVLRFKKQWLISA